MKTRKFMQTLDDRYFEKLERFAFQKGTTIQQLIRASIVPDWLEKQRLRERDRRRRHARLSRRVADS